MFRRISFQEMLCSRTRKMTIVPCSFSPRLKKKKITPIGRTAVRQTNVSRYRGRPMRALLKLFGPSLHFCIEAPLVRLPLLPRNVRLSDSCTTERCCFSGLSSHNSYTPDQNFHPLGIMERIDEKIV